MKRLVVWGGTRNLDSFRWIQRGFFQTANKMGIPSRWVDDDPASHAELTPGTTVIAADVTGKFLTARPDVNYVLHNFDGRSPLCQSLDPERLLRLQVWTDDANGEQWDMFRKFDREARTLFQPWGTDLLSEEFMEPVYNGQDREVVFVGAIWSDYHPAQGQVGNEAAIEELRLVVADFGLRFVHHTQISESAHVLAIREARLAPTIASAWQSRVGYLPCRMWKNISYGALGVTNVPQFKPLFGDTWIDGDNIGELMRRSLSLHRNEYLDLVRAQQLRIAGYSYRENLLAISRALEEM